MPELKKTEKCAYGCGKVINGHPPPYSRTADGNPLAIRDCYERYTKSRPSLYAPPKTKASQTG